jgi:hypothetical protein
VLVAAAVCPHPPLLVPAALGAAGFAAHETAHWYGDRPVNARFHRPGREPQDSSPDDADDAAGAAGDAQIMRLRSACGAAVGGLAAARPDLIAVVGGADQTAEFQASAAGSLRRFGIPFTTGSGEPVLPLSLTVGGWLVRRFLPAVPGQEPWRLQLRAVRQSMPTAQCLRLGAELAARAHRVALLIMGDGCARKVTGVPGAADPAAETYDAEVAAALADADPGRLAALDAALDGELMVAGRAAWQVLAGAADGRSLRGRLLFAAAPLDVSYLVAAWATLRPLYRRPA